MGIATLFRCLRIPVYGQWLALDRCAIKTANRHALWSQGHNFTFVDDQDTPRVFKDSGNIRSQELLILAQAYNQGTAAATCSYNELRLFAADHCNCIGT